MIRVKATEVSGKLNVRQRYLLDRIPRTYDLNGLHLQEPAEVTQAKQIVDRWEKKAAHQHCIHTKRTEALIRKAREAVYFSTEEKALAIIQQIEKLLKTCAE